MGHPEMVGWVMEGQITARATAIPSTALAHKGAVSHFVQDDRRWIWGDGRQQRKTVSAVVRGGLLLLGFWNAIRVDDVGWKRDKTVTSTWGRLRGAVAVASLSGMMVLCAQSGVARQTQSSTDTTEQTKKPASKSKTTSAGKADGSGRKPAGSNKPAGSSKTTKSKSA